MTPMTRVQNGRKSRGFQPCHGRRPESSLCPSGRGVGGICRGFARSSDFMSHNFSLVRCSSMRMVSSDSMRSFHLDDRSLQLQRARLALPRSGRLGTPPDPGCLVAARVALGEGGHQSDLMINHRKTKTMATIGTAAPPSKTVRVGMPGMLGWACRSCADVEAEPFVIVVFMQPIQTSCHRCDMRDGPVGICDRNVTDKRNGSIKDGLML